MDNLSTRQEHGTKAKIYIDLGLFTLNRPDKIVVDFNAIVIGNDVTCATGPCFKIVDGGSLT